MPTFKTSIYDFHPISIAIERFETFGAELSNTLILMTFQNPSPKALGGFQFSRFREKIRQESYIVVNSSPCGFE